jgi:hypothetical protein
MARQKILPAAMVAVLPVAFALAAQSLRAEATNSECRTTPGSTTPNGEHWYYGLSRPDNKRCWYLSRVRAELHSRVAVSTAHRTFNRRGSGLLPGAIQQEKRELNVQTAFASSSVGERALPEPFVSFASRWISQEADPYDTGRLSYTDNAYLATKANSQMALAKPAVDADGARTSQASTAKVPVAFFLFAGASAIALLRLAAWTFKLARRSPSLNPQKRAASNRLGSRGPSSRQAVFVKSAVDRTLPPGAQRHASAWRSPTPINPDDDFKIALRELMGALRRAGAAPYTLRSFAPPSRNWRNRVS